MRTRRITARLASVGAAAVLTISLAACGSSSTEGESTTEPASSPATTAPPEKPSEKTDDANSDASADPSDDTDASDGGPTDTKASTSPGAPTDDADDDDDADADDDKDDASAKTVDPKDVPSKEEFIALTVKQVRANSAEDGSLDEMKEAGITDEQFDRFFTCFSEEIYPHLSDESKVAISKGEDLPSKPGNEEQMMTALVTCGQKEPKVMEYMMKAMG